MQNHTTTVSRTAISERAERASELSGAISGIRHLLSENSVRKVSDGDAPFMNGYVEGCLHDALGVISGAMMNLADDIERLSKLETEAAQ